MHHAVPASSHQPYTVAAPLTPESLSSDAGIGSYQCASAMEDLGPHQQAQSHSQHHPQPLPSPSTPSGNVLTPTWRGMVMSTIDALKIIEACLTGVLLHTARRPHDREREHLIRSGNVFVYEESSSGIKRWTDGQNWSPSRILGNYLIYRELDKNFPPGDKKRAIKRKRDGKPEMQNGSPHNTTPGGPTSLNDERERALLGSLIDSYPFKEGGLIKKTISIKWNNVMHHLVSYYSLEDARNHRLAHPNDDPKLAHLRPRPELIQLQDFRVPVEQEDPRFLDDRAMILGMMPHGMPHSSYAHPPLERTLSLPQMANNMMPPYGTNQYLSMPVGNPMSSSMSMNSFQSHSSGGYGYPYEQQPPRPRAPPMATGSFASTLPTHLLDAGKRRRSDAYDNPSDQQDLFSPVGSHPHEHMRSHGYFPHGTSTSYSIPSISTTTLNSENGEYKPSVPSMGPPSTSSTTSELASDSTTLAYAHAPSSLTSSSSDYPSASTVSQSSHDGWAESRGRPAVLRALSKFLELEPRKQLVCAKFEVTEWLAQYPAIQQPALVARHREMAVVT